MNAQRPPERYRTKHLAIINDADHIEKPIRDALSVPRLAFSLATWVPINLETNQIVSSCQRTKTFDVRANLDGVIRDRCRGSCLPVDVRFAPKATEVLSCREMTRMGWTGRAPAPNGSESTLGLARTRSTAMPRTSAVHAVTTLGIDMGKNALHMTGLDTRGGIVLREKVSRGRITSRLANLPPCLFGIEAGMATHYVAREPAALCHDVKQVLPDIIAKRTDVLSPRMVRMVADLASDWRQLDERIEAVTDEIKTLTKSDDSCRRVMTVPGIGPIVSSAMVAAIGSGAAFGRGRDFFGLDRPRP
jgi:hypothetical protein